LSTKLNHRLSPLAVAATDAGLAEIDACPAVRLFRERAGGGMQPSLETERAVGLMGEICRRVDGLPLAIELTAAMVAGLELEAISQHLGDLFDLLPQAARRADGSQRSLRSTVEWSDALLSDDERRLLRRLAVFAGGFDLTAINAVCANDDQSAAKIAGLTARLVERSLLLKHETTGEYQLLETIRQYATEQLALDGDLDEIRDRHARFFLEIGLRESGAMMTGPERPHLDVLERIEDNTRVALERLLQIDPEAALGLASSLNIFWYMQGKLREGISWIERARDGRSRSTRRAAGDELVLQWLSRRARHRRLARRRNAARSRDRHHHERRLRHGRTAVDPRHAALPEGGVATSSTTSRSRPSHSPRRATTSLSGTRARGVRASAPGTWAMPAGRTATRTVPSGCS
jgi:predicted ATPase